MNDKVVSLLKFICLIYVVTLVPKIVSFYSSLSNKSRDKRFRMLLGVENLAYSKQYEILKKITFGVVGKRSSVDLLKENGFTVKKIFQPNRLKKLPDRALTVHCKKLDALVLDLENSGISSDKTIKILKRLLKFSAQHNKKIIVLDRPNPLGAVVEGPGVVPWRHGLTIGELAHYINRNLLKKPGCLEVVPLKRWRRGRLTQKSNVLQPLRCLQSVKGKLSLWETRYLKRLCWKLGLHCFDCDNQEVLVKGVKLRIKSDVNNFSLFNSLLTVARFLKNRKQVRLTFARKFDDKVGSAAVRRFLEHKISFDVLKKEIEESLDSFYDNSKLCCLYKPFPVVVRPAIVRG